MRNPEQVGGLKSGLKIEPISGSGELEQRHCLRIVFAKMSQTDFARARQTQGTNFQRSMRREGIITGRFAAATEGSAEPPDVSFFVEANALCPAASS